ncbi:MAG: acyl-CoA dehydrogenase family protein [Alphaproteobacteria bacterium]|nr:acyl-CoA dehydrogenase family protein [Alphaproteobacteria bacterium]
MTDLLDFAQPDMPAGEAALRREVQGFLKDHASGWSPTDRALSWTGFDRDFSREVGARGWIGLTWPKPHGHGRSQVERYIVVEEMLAAGAPVGAHWIADRQSGPQILNYGTAEQQKRLLSGIVRGETAFCIGMSEPDAGSDLASVRSRATQTEGGWRLDGRKIWATNAHLCDFMIALFRTCPVDTEKRHEGLTQFIVDLRSSGLEIREIKDLTGGHHFNEIVFDGVFVPDAMVLGTPGDGWRQVTAELANERSGPERYLTAFPLLSDAMNQASETDGAAMRSAGEMVARYATLRAMSLSVAGMLDRARDVAQQAAIVKDLGTTLEQETPSAVRALVAEPDPPLEAMLHHVTCAAPTFSIRGGTRQIMRGIIARGLGVR